jgi:hypothetical protein
MAACSYCRRLNIDSIRWVTRNPPKMLTLARVTAMKPKAMAQPLVPRPADSDHRGNRVGHRHQRRMQRRGDVPHHVVADEAGHQEDGEQEDDRLDLGGDRGDAAGECLGVLGKLVGALGEPGGFVGQLGRVHWIGLRWIRRWAN